MKRFIAALIVLLPLSASAAEERALTLDEAVRVAVRNGKTSRMAALDAAAAHAQADEARATGKPQVKAQASYSRLSDVGPFQIQPNPLAPPVTVSPSITNSYQAKLSATYPLFTGNRIEGMTEAAEYGAMAADRLHETSIAETVLAVRIAYWNVYKTREAKRVIDQTVAQVRAHLADVTNMVNAGILLRDEQLKAEVQLSNARFAQVDAANNMRLAAMTLNSIVGFPLDTLIDPASAPDAGDAALKPVDQYRADALNARPDLIAVKMQAQAEQAGYTASKGGWYPAVTLFADLTYANPNQRYQPTHDRWDSSWAAGIMLSYDLLDWGITSGQVRRAEAQQARAEIAYERARDNVELEVEQSYLHLAQARERIGIATAGAAQAAESARIVNDRFHAGDATNTQVLDAELALLQARLNETVAIADAAIARARLQKAVAAPDALPGKE